MDGTVPHQSGRERILRQGADYLGRRRLRPATFSATSTSASVTSLAAPAPNAVRLTLARSTNGGTAWSSMVVEGNQNAASGQWALASGATGCTIRTDSEGTVYLFWHGFNQQTKEEGVFPVPVVRWWGYLRRTAEAVHGPPDRRLRPRDRSQLDGWRRGSPRRLSTSPSVDIANGAPTGTRATGRIRDDVG